MLDCYTTLSCLKDVKNEEERNGENLHIYIDGFYVHVAHPCTYDCPEAVWANHSAG